jgi:biotin transport system substrate-specific component
VSFTPALAQRLFPQRTLGREIVLQVAGIALVGALAQLSVPLWPVPVTGQTLGVLLVGAFLGVRRGTAAMVLYVGLGSMGLPLFADFSGGPAHLAGPTGGYLIGFILSAATVGLLAEHGFLRRYLSTALAMIVATTPVFVLGVAWLLHYVAPADAFHSGFLIFLPGAAAKIAVATAIAGRR